MRGVYGVNKSTLLVLLGLSVLPGHPAAAGAGTELRVLATHPAGDEVTLGTNQNYYLRIGYSTDEPVRIWARPYYRGEAVNAGSNPSPVYTGSGEALGWFFFFEPGDRADEIRITAGDGSAAGTRLMVSHPVRLVAGNRPAADAGEPAWLTDLLRENERQQREAYEKQMNTPPSAGETVFFGVFMLAVAGLGLAGVAAPSWAMLRWHGRWRIGAAVPGTMVAFVVLRIFVDTARDPTSHNLWPFEILQVGLLSIAIVGVLAIARKFRGLRA